MAPVAMTIGAQRLAPTPVVTTVLIFQIITRSPGALSNPITTIEAASYRVSRLGGGRTTW
ncbi:hypothetical protein ACW2Q0_23280 [Nocardia sp. R16R-3T]